MEKAILLEKLENVIHDLEVVGGESLSAAFGSEIRDLFEDVKDFIEDGSEKRTNQKLDRGRMVEVIVRGPGNTGKNAIAVGIANMINSFGSTFSVSSENPKLISILNQARQGQGHLFDHEQVLRDLKENDITVVIRTEEREAVNEVLPGKLTPADIEKAISDETYTLIPETFITVCVLTLKNGFKTTGINHGPVNPKNFDAEEGKRYARAEAIEKVWELEGYLLKQKYFEARR